LLFFAGRGGKGLVHHVAVYVGGGRVIDSPYTGASVEIVPMTSLPVWDEFAGAIRLTLASAPAFQIRSAWSLALPVVRLHHTGTAVVSDHLPVGSSAT
jgi:hypothetical protein